MIPALNDRIRFNPFEGQIDSLSLTLVYVGSCTIVHYRLGHRLIGRSREEVKQVFKPTPDVTTTEVSQTPSDKQAQTTHNNIGSNSLSQIPILFKKITIRR